MHSHIELQLWLTHFCDFKIVYMVIILIYQSYKKTSKLVLRIAPDKNIIHLWRYLWFSHACDITQQLNFKENVHNLSCYN